MKIGNFHVKGQQVLSLACMRMKYFPVHAFGQFLRFKSSKTAARKLHPFIDRVITNHAKMKKEIGLGKQSGLFSALY